MEKNQHSQSFYIVLIATIILIVLSFVQTKFNLFGFQAKKVDLFSDVSSSADSSHLATALASKKVMKVLKDTSGHSLPPPDSSCIVDYGEDSIPALAHFFEVLNIIKSHKDKKKKKVHIAYFGDSMVEGDVLTEDFRTCLQDTFGGNGVGFMPVTSIVSKFRATINHTFKGWDTYTLLDTPDGDYPLGISGYSFIPGTLKSIDTAKPKTNTWVRYSTVNKAHLDKFYESKLLYGKSDGDNYAVINDKTYTLKGDKTVNELVINDGSPLESVEADFLCKSKVDIYGFSFESDSGIFVDNFSFRGNSGMPLTKVPQNVYTGTNDYEDYDLVILAYGLNAVTPTETNFTWFTRGTINMVKYIRQCFPHASIMMISVGDKAYRHAGQYETEPSVPLLVEEQRQIAIDNKFAFWSLYHAIGGYGTMTKWVEGDTTYAYKDYTHFNQRGAHRVGVLLYNKLMKKYAEYNKVHGKKPV